MDIHASTARFEEWLGRHCRLHQPDLEYKRQAMADPANPFPFFRGAYYRWLERWTEICPELEGAPLVLAVGDLHVENFGTWRDSDGRLVWGINDFDEAAELPYVHDLVRLAASMRFARQAGVLHVKLGKACAAIVNGYRDHVEKGGLPFVLEERNLQLRALAMAKEREPARFWKKLTTSLEELKDAPPEEAAAALRQALPEPQTPCLIRFRPRVGMGSLGKPRFVALSDCQGGWLAREAKAVTPPATVLTRPVGPQASRSAEIVARAVRCPDPFYRPGPRWTVRRLAPRCSRIELEHLRPIEDQLLLVESMGREAANVHLGTRGAAPVILADLKRRPADWLEEAARRMGEALAADWKAWGNASR